jgi:hypothetical protein
MKAISLRNRKIMVDLNLKLAVVAQTKKRDSILSFKLPSNFLEIIADQPGAIDEVNEDSKEFDTNSISDSVENHLQRAIP